MPHLAAAWFSFAFMAWLEKKRWVLSSRIQGALLVLEMGEHFHLGLKKVKLDIPNPGLYCCIV